MRAGILVVAALLLALPAHADAPAEEMSPAARKHKQAGAAFMLQEKYRSAIREFEHGFALDPKPSILYELAQAQVLAQRPQKAAASFRKYLELVPDAPNREELEEEIKALDARATTGAKPASKAAPAPPKAQPTEPEETPAEAPRRPAGVLPQMFDTQHGRASQAEAEEPAMVSRGVAIPLPGGGRPAVATAPSPAAPRTHAPAGAIEAPPAVAPGTPTRWGLWAGLGVGVAAAAAVVVGAVLLSGKPQTEPSYTVDAR